jgi:hypothetical protein
MKSLSRILSVAALGAAVVFSSLSASAQDANGDNNGGGGGGRRNRGGGQGGPGGGGPGGNFDPAQMRQRMAERMREQFGVKDDTEWKLISERIEKVSDARRDMGGRGGMGMMWGGRGGGPGGQGGPGGGQVNAEQEALQKAIESNAPADEIKTKLAKYRASQKDKEAKLAKAQEDLRQVLTVKQEATAVLLGLLK